nr:hypothetical protein CFP56_38311 [Quercus suber]
MTKKGPQSLYLGRKSQRVVLSLVPWPNVPWPALRQEHARPDLPRPALRGEYARHNSGIPDQQSVPDWEQ